ECRYQKPVPYRLATPQLTKGVASQSQFDKGFARISLFGLMSGMRSFISAFYCYPEYGSARVRLFSRTI
ncbi:MAG: hypothetical protein V4691_04020, partial [Pseudomonadota bacterium]